ncbi:hypothetical protein BDV10DRAFT_192228 [Aspergillus recurvatus]
MGSIGTIYTHPYNPRGDEGAQFQAAAALNGRTVSIIPNFIVSQTNRSPQFLHDFPLGKVPAFKSVTGIRLFRIRRHCPCRERTLIRQRTGFTDHELFERLQSMALWRHRMGPFDEGVEATSLRWLELSLDVLKRHLCGREYLVSSHLSLADLSVAAAMGWGFGQAVDKKIRGRYPITV